MEILPEKIGSDSELALTENMELQELSTPPPPQVSTSTSLSNEPPKQQQHRKVSVRFKTTPSIKNSTTAATEPSTLTILETSEDNNEETEEGKDEENVQQQKIELIEDEDEDEKEEKKEKSAKSASAATVSTNLSGILRKVGSSLMGRPAGPTPPGGSSPFVSTFVTGRAESTSTLERFIFNLVIIAALMLLMGLFLGGRYLWYRVVDWI